MFVSPLGDGLDCDACTLIQILIKLIELLILPVFSHGSLYLQSLRYIFVISLGFVSDTILKLFFKKIRFHFLQISYSLAAEARGHAIQKQFISFAVIMITIIHFGN